MAHDMWGIMTGGLVLYSLAYMLYLLIKSVGESFWGGDSTMPYDATDIILKRRQRRGEFAVRNH